MKAANLILLYLVVSFSYRLGFGEIIFNNLTIAICIRECIWPVNWFWCATLRQASWVVLVSLSLRIESNIVNDATIDGTIILIVFL